MRSNNTFYQEIRDYLDTVPVINTHEHQTGITAPVDNVFAFIPGYYTADLISSAPGSKQEKEVRDAIGNSSMPFDRRFELFERHYRRSNKTAYARAMLAGLRECWGIEDVSRDSLLRLEQLLKTRNQHMYEEWMERHHIKAAIVDIISAAQFLDIIEGRDTNYTTYCKFALTLPAFHDIHAHEDIFILQNYLDRKITTLDDYMESFENMLRKAVDFGIVCLKDQSAYRRPLNYANPGKAEAESVFNRIITQRTDTFSTAEAQPLDDFLMHYFMRLARRYDLPVQLHTGHLAGNRGDIRQTNAAQLIPLMELHSEVRFDLFHANWPYMDEYLFIGKNYPNVYLDLCWTHSIDPLYCVELMKRIVVAVAHSKVMVFGGDTRSTELTIGYLIGARDNTACALSEMVDCGWLDMSEAKQLANDWFFNNPNEFFRLGFDPI